MLTSKQRSALNGLAMTIEPSLRIGKSGVGENTLKELDALLTARELIKVGVLKNCEYTSKELIGDIAEKLNAEPVAAIGSVMIFYRYSDKKDIKHIKF